MKTVLLILSLCGSFYTCRALTIDMVAYGGVADGRTDNTAIIQRAIDACSEQKGTILFPAGKYLTGALFLRSNVHIRLEAGAEILGSTDLEAYLKAFPNRRGKESPDERPMFYLDDAAGIEILSCKNNHRAADVKNNHPDGSPNLSHTSANHPHTCAEHSYTCADHSHTCAEHSHTSADHPHTCANHSHTSADHPHTCANHSHTCADHSHTDAKQMKSNFTN
ncbi:MAG: hypothetical protein LBL04_09450 [Bacteroidales bacterium]|nr:hypothetical protein [Bacteroidales bacterium]